MEGEYVEDIWCIERKRMVGWELKYRENKGGKEEPFQAK